MITKQAVILKYFLLSAVFISLSAPGISFAISNDSTNFTSTVTSGTTTYRTTVQGQRPVPMTILTTGASPFQGTTTTFTSLGLSSTRSCTNLDPIYSSFQNGQAQGFSMLTQNTSSAITTTKTLGLIYLRVNPETGSSSNVLVGFKKGDGPITLGNGAIDAFLKPILQGFTNSIGIKDWDYSVTTTTAPAQYNIQCGYTSPALTWVTAP